MFDTAVVSLQTEFQHHASGLIKEFTGREWLVDKVRLWLETDKKPFLLILGEAGIGKSAFAAHLWLDKQLITAIHFCIAGRGGTTEPLTFVESLSNQLAASLSGFAKIRQECLSAYFQPSIINSQVNTRDVFEGGQVTGVAVMLRGNIDAEQAFDVLIRRPLKQLEAENKLPTIVLLVDALDEAITYHGTFTILDLLSIAHDFPTSVRWVLTSRSDTKVTNKLANLPTEILDASSSNNCQDVHQFMLMHWGQLEETASIWKMEQEVFLKLLGEKSEWNFLYLTQILPELAKGHVRTSSELPVGLEGYYQYLLASRIGLEVWDEWGADLAEVLLVLQEPVDVEFFSNILGWNLRETRQRIRKIVQLLDPALLQDGRYYRHHWAVAEYLFDPNKAGEFWCDPNSGHNCIVSHYQKASGEDWISLIVQKYPRCNLIHHLIASKQYEVASHILINSDQWAKARLQYEGNYNGYQADLLELWRVMTEKGDIGSSIRVALCYASVVSSISNFDADLLIQCVKVRIISPIMALMYANQRSDPLNSTKTIVKIFQALSIEEQTAIKPVFLENLGIIQILDCETDRAHELSIIAPYIPDQLLPKALVKAEKVKDAAWRARVLSSLVIYLPDDLKTRAAKEALEAIEKIEDEFDRAKELSSLGPHLPIELQPNILDVIEKVQSSSWHNHALKSLLPFLPNHLFYHTLKAAEEIQNQEDRAHRLSVFIPFLPPDLKPKVLKETLEAVEMIQDGNSRIDYLIKLIPQLPIDLRLRALIKVQEDIKNILEASKQAYALCKISPYLPLAQQTKILKDALETTEKIEDASERADELVCLFDYLPIELKTIAFLKALEAVEKILDDKKRERYLGRLAKYLPEDLKIKALQESLEILIEIKDEFWQAESLKIIAPYLPLEIAHKYLEVTKNMQYDWLRTLCLCRIAPFLPIEQLTEALQEALKTAIIINDNIEQGHVLSAISPYLSGQIKTTVLKEMKKNKGKIAENINSLSYSSAAHTTPSSLEQRARDLYDAIKIEDESKRAIKLDSIANDIPVNLMSQALEAAMNIQDDAFRTRALSALAPRLPTQFLFHALESAEKIQSKFWRAVVLGTLAPHLPTELQSKVIKEAKDAAEKIQETDWQTKALGGVASHLPSEYTADFEGRFSWLRDLLEWGKMRENDIWRARVLIALAPNLPIKHLPHALNVAKQMQSEEEMVKAINVLALYLPPNNILYSLLIDIIEQKLFVKEVFTQCVRHWDDICHLAKMDGVTLFLLILKEYMIISRSELFQVIESIYPVLQYLGGKNCLAQTAQAILDVSYWWP